MDTRTLKNFLAFLIVCFTVLTSCLMDGNERNRIITEFEDIYDVGKIPWDELTGVIAYYANSDLCPSCLGLIELPSQNHRHVSITSNLLPYQEGTILSYLVWASKDDELTFVNSTIHDDVRLFDLGTDGTNRKILYPEYPYPDKITATAPSWSNDGRVAYLVKRAIYTELDIREDNVNEIWIDDQLFMKAYTDGDNPASNRFFVRSRPAWSPDNNDMIVSVTNRRGYSALWKINIDRKSHEILLEDESPHDSYGAFYDPVYSPDGNYIAFHAHFAGEAAHRVWIIDADGKNLRSPTEKRGHFPVWSPDGKYLLYGSPRYGRFEFGNLVKYESGLYLVHSDGGDPILFTPNHIGGWFPAWRP